MHFPMRSSALLIALALGSNAYCADLAPKDKQDSPPKWNVNAPPGEASTVNIDVQNGTWMSVDVSPDGKTLVFDLLGDLYTLPIAGGEAKPLTHSVAWEMQARFSPDGKQIAYVSDEGGGDNIWVMNADGSATHAITKEDFRLLNNPVWHPNGQYIAARKHFTGSRSLGSGEIWLYHTGGGKGLQLNEKPNWQKDLGEPAFSPDGRYVYFSRDTTGGKSFEYNKDSNKQIFQIFRLDTRTNETESFVSGPGGAVRPTPSPDGKFLAFVRRVRNQSTLFLKDLQSGREFPAWEHLERDMQEAWSVQGVYPAFTWLPDSKEIVVWAQGKLWRVDPFKQSGKEIAFHVKDTREVRKAVRFQTEVAPDQFDVKQLRWVNVSPAGNRVVYSALGHLYIRNLPDGTPTRISKASNRFEYYPAFSRDGKDIVFISWQDQEQGRVVKLNLDSGKETVLTKQPGKYLEPSFSPDGKTVVYSKSRGGELTSPWNGLETGVYAVSADGKSEPVLITKDGEAPQFGLNNHEIFVTRGGQEGEVDFYSKLVRIDLSDHNREQEVAKGEFASNFSISPDGKWLAFGERFHSYVTPFPASNKPIQISGKMDALPVRQLDAIAGHALHWSGDSTKLYYNLGDELFTTELKQAFDFVAGAPKELPKPPEHGTRIGFKQQADKPDSTIIIKGARLVTMRGDEVIENGTIVIKGNRIAAIGAADTVDAPKNAQVIDATGKTIIPGLIDVHWHGGMGEDEIIPQQSWVDFASLAFGITTLHDPSNKTTEIFTHAEMQRAGEVVAPRIFSTGTILYGAKAPFTATINSEEDAQGHLKRQKAEGAISVKSYNQPRREQRQQVLAAAEKTGMMVVPEGGSLFQTNMTMVVDGHTGVEHAIPVERAYDDVKQLWAHTQVGYTPTLNVAYGGLDGEHYWYARTDVWRHPLLSKYVPRSVLEPRSIRRETAPEEDFNVVRVAKTATELSRAGVKVNIGAHGQREGLGAHWEMWMFAMGGMSSLEAIRAATANPAHYLGMEKDIGSLEAGKLADLVVIEGDVLKDIRQSDRITQVMVNGRLYDSATMNEVAPRKRNRQPLFFEGDGNASMPVVTSAHGHGHGD
ncbi:amidohydrolase family protein [Burkholderiaceae bacterium DAT-1]|nr:amidohydrolase family protein [Burkholderiaceae bacterium DAT-1]